MHPQWNYNSKSILVHMCLYNLECISFLKMLEKDVKRGIGQ